MTTTTSLSTVELEQLAAEYTERAEAVSADLDRMKEIKTLLQGSLQVGSHDLAGVRVQIRAGARRLDTKAVAEAYPVSEHPEMYALAVDTAKVKHHLSPAALAAFQTQGAPTVVIGA